MKLFNKLFCNESSNDTFDDLGCDWYCDGCEAFMNDQPGFTTSSGIWICTECGTENDVTENNILYDFYDDEDGETLGVYDAALIWESNGKDEDYTFGYSEDELEDALK
ncbi:MAG: hypothetical protein PT934_02855 [Peptoniphilaceae bacterium]|nr:hypothetical protein [Peptoniphilaceae bacterium]